MSDLEKSERQLIQDFHKTCPEAIYLQVYGDGTPDETSAFEEHGDVTWSSDLIHETDLYYIREDLVQRQIEDAVKQERERCVMTVEQIDYKWPDGSCLDLNPKQTPGTLVTITVEGR